VIVKRFKALQWVSVNLTQVAGCEVEEFIDITGNYVKKVWADGYTEIEDIHAIHTGQAIKNIKTLGEMSVYKSPKMRYNIITVNETENKINTED
jgi:hypothetical protein